MSAKRPKQQKAQKPRCPRCRHPEFARSEGFDRPRYTCTKCGNSWTCGKDGGEFAAAAKEQGQ